ncbi:MULTISPECIES: DUF937 domain-containing protein [unclassified Rhizobium]|jgi:hypothetical protein|uniref:DUF937 domain-containing protein n=1 Tax=unclassified Rhizobium TaxID=2613769 RepID=UPI0006489C02|nr:MULTISPECIES: DUF937 domain-containing protein [unclassified Rhizobium]MBN8950276.1 DUF937 domain-containing protein [Rhizobium tropici]OJY68818.1 MAG: hypothetical protein BGP09_09040 [Rhizobium sp. 60-20]RKD74426.1 hypothetical protein BJ928_101778 [Rhizobium sp. WW_1]
MLPLFDMMMQAQNGAATEAMAKQFNLAQEQATKAMAALMPAFSSGFKRSATDPYNFMGVMQDIASGNYAKYFEDMTKAFTPEGIADGNAVLGRLFGSKDVSRAIAAQAAQMTGIGQEIYKRMLPAMADTLMGGLFKETSGQIPPMTNPFLNTDMGAVMQGWLQSIGFAPKQQPTPQASIFDNPFTQAMELMFGADAVKREKLAQTNPFLDNPFAKAFQDMMKNFPMAAEPPKEEAKAKPSAGVDMAAYTDMFNAMFDSGLEVQKTYQKNMEAIFDSYLKGQDKPAPKAE